MYQVSGTRRVRCISFESSGLPLAVRLPATTQLLEPTAQFSQLGISPEGQHRGWIFRRVPCGL